MAIEINIDLPEHTASAISEAEALVLQKNEQTVRDAINYLASTDYMMTADYDKDTTEVRIKRAEARAIIRGT